MIHIRYFASIREWIGSDREELEFSHDIQTIEGVLRICRTHSERHATALASSKPIRAALNQTLSALDSPVQDEDEIAFFPPVTGG